MAEDNNELIDIKENNNTEDNSDKAKEPLKDTSDEISLSADDLTRIITESKLEYEQLDEGEKTSHIPKLLLMFAIIIVLVMISKTMKSARNVTVEREDVQSYTVVLDKNANVVESHQSPLR